MRSTKFRKCYGTVPGDANRLKSGADAPSRHIGNSLAGRYLQTLLPDWIDFIAHEVFPCLPLSN